MGCSSDGKKSSILSSSTRDSHGALSKAQWGLEEGNNGSVVCWIESSDHWQPGEEGRVRLFFEVGDQVEPAPAHAGPRRKAPDFVGIRTGAAAGQRAIENGPGLHAH